jgi:hypothetical protein
MRATMSKQLTFSATAAVLSMAAFALVAGHGGLSLEQGDSRTGTTSMASYSATR